MARLIAFFALPFILTVTVHARALADEPTETKSTTVTSDDGEFVVHEWGTFTTFSGSDGVFLDFRPLDANHNDLPNYVLDRASYAKNPLLFLSKSRLRGRVRMETPITYFYTDRPRTVDVRVDFPKGLLTEFYPPVREILPAIDEENIFGNGELIGKSSLNWGAIDLIPISALVPNLTNSGLRDIICKNIVSGLVPHASNEQHYAAARETDAAIVHLRNDTSLTSHFEKFLFYRGVGKFELPINVEFHGEQAVLLNSATQSLKSAILIDVQGGAIQAMRIDDIKSGQALPFNNLRSVTNDDLARMVRECLVAEGLFEKEAAAMVATWQQAWFTDNGMRVLYMVPGSITDELIPLQITPKPQQTLRVLVGRMEIMSPTSEKEMTIAITESATARALHYAQQINLSTKTSYSFPEKILAFGRMAEPAIARVATIVEDQSLRDEAKILINEIQGFKKL